MKELVEVIAKSLVEHPDEVVVTETENEKVYQSFVDAVRKRSIYDTGITAVYGDKLLTLSTCEYSQKNGRMVVVAKKIKA